MKFELFFPQIIANVRLMTTVAATDFAFQSRKNVMVTTTAGTNRTRKTVTEQKLAI